MCYHFLSCFPLFIIAQNSLNQKDQCILKYRYWETQDGASHNLWSVPKSEWAIEHGGQTILKMHSVFVLFPVVDPARAVLVEFLEGCFALLRRQGRTYFLELSSAWRKDDYGVSVWLITNICRHQISGNFEVTDWYVIPVGQRVRLFTSPSKLIVRVCDGLVTKGAKLFWLPAVQVGAVQ